MTASGASSSISATLSAIVSAVAGYATGSLALVPALQTLMGGLGLMFIKDAVS